MRKFKNKYKIQSYNDLSLAIQQLKVETVILEKEILEKPIVKMVSSLNKKQERKETFLGMLMNSKESLSSTIIKSFFMSNKLTRKYFTAYMVAKEIIPQAVNEIKNAVNKSEE